MNLLSMGEGGRKRRRGVVSVVIYIVSAKGNWSSGGVIFCRGLVGLSLSMPCAWADSLLELDSSHLLLLFAAAHCRSKRVWTRD